MSSLVISRLQGLQRLKFACRRDDLLLSVVVGAEEARS
jgi:hypothetical protein